MEQSEKNINPKYIAMVFRFKLLQGSGKTFPNIVKRYKMIEAFKTWYNKHVHELTSDEREYLQAIFVLSAPIKMMLTKSQRTKTLGMIRRQF